MKEVPFEDRFGMLVVRIHCTQEQPAEEASPEAEFEQPDEAIADIDYGHNRKLNRTLIDGWRPVSTSQSTGTSLSPARPAVERPTWPVPSEWKPANTITLYVNYVRMPDLLIDLKSAKDAGRFTDVLKKLTSPAC